MIKKLPKNIINIISAWEVVERPSSVLKELIENSLDANAQNIDIEIIKWWKSLIKITENWTWISKDDLPLSIERYATSKISIIEDLEDIKHFWFRGEALSAISEVSKFTIQTKTIKNDVWHQLKKIWDNTTISDLSLPFDHGSIIIVEDLFFNTPVREKFLKSEQTEYNYIHKTIIDFAIGNTNITIKFKHNWKTILNIWPSNSLQNRILQLYPNDWKKNLITLNHKDKETEIYWFIGKPILKFSTPNFKLYVNSRPVEDKIIKKAILQWFDRWIEPWMYPFAVLFLKIQPTEVDVNVHPRKKEVKFRNPWSIFNLIKNTIKSSIEDSWKKLDDKISSSSFDTYHKKYNKDRYTPDNSLFDNIKTKIETTNVYSQQYLEGKQEERPKEQSEDKWTLWDIKIIWQIYDSYIIIEKWEEILFVDQHAVAERILFEKLKKECNSKIWEPMLLLTPIKINIKKIGDLDSKLEQLQKFWFDISMFGEDKLIIYAIPEIFEKYNVDTTTLLDWLLYSDEISLDKILNQIFATKACKSSIKANTKLSYPEMEQLIKDWINNINWFFVCQHGRPSIVSVGKDKIDKLFERKK